eukprot:253102_1
MEDRVTQMMDMFYQQGFSQDDVPNAKDLSDLFRFMGNRKNCKIWIRHFRVNGKLKKLQYQDIVKGNCAWTLKLVIIKTKNMFVFVSYSICSGVVSHNHLSIHNLDGKMQENYVYYAGPTIDQDIRRKSKNNGYMHKLISELLQNKHFSFDACYESLRKIDNYHAFFDHKLCNTYPCYLCIVKEQITTDINKRLLLSKYFSSFHELSIMQIDMAQFQSIDGVVCELVNVSKSRFEIVIIVRDMYYNERTIYVKLSDKPAVEFPTLPAGSLLMIWKPLLHHFLDVSVTITIKDCDMRHISYMLNLSLRHLNYIDSTGYLMEGYHDYVLLNKAKQNALYNRCWYSNCSNFSNGPLYRCSGCHGGTYCSVDHQRKDWKLRHRKICNQLQSIRHWFGIDSLSKYFRSHSFYSWSKVSGLLKDTSLKSISRTNFPATY